MKIFQIYGKGNHKDENVPNDLKNYRWKYSNIFLGNHKDENVPNG